MIKSVTVNPVKIDGDDAIAGIMEVDVEALYALYVKEGINPETITVPYVTVAADGSYENGEMSLLDAFNEKHEVSFYYTMYFGYTVG